MRSPSLRSCLLPVFAVVAAGCANDTSLAPRALKPSFSIGGGGCSRPFLTSGILQPIHADNSSSFQLGRTVPVKLRVTDCVTGEAVNTLAPTISLVLVDQGGVPVNDIESSSAADTGNTMRSAGDGQYIFNLSTKLSQFNGGQDLTPGPYQLTISSGGQFTDIVVQFSIRP